MGRVRNAVRDTSGIAVVLGRNGFSSALYFGAYDPSVVPGETDRLVAVAQNLEAAA
jgi:hypothetical protein